MENLFEKIKDKKDDLVSLKEKLLIKKTNAEEQVLKINEKIKYVDYLIEISNGEN
jgi:hypothetical protein